ncbi:sucrose-6-phosphate hydrolase [Bacillus carboniphilus]|uniref:Sucrose-6-phosphate hydrolase n=1 Tax=Bacillus carboniphilus TaxID=86663 RepID=A0ABY9JSM7_9BACI|nr:sucrose-6-phosphate hydrolase [Bacillus carboniphilus]WLR42399.1 sucrose-6-phosphate hydrolase [Bacillus carboniphilus]
MLEDLVKKEVDKHKKKVEQDSYRLSYHLMPPVGLLNDPNGFIQWRGQYHLFYQWNPFETGHGAKFWGHYQSKDLVHWQDYGVALSPTNWFDKNGCYSGSAVEDSLGKLVLFYTGNVKDEQGNRQTYQCRAISEDGLHFEKEGVVIELPEGYTAHFRDPKVWKHEDLWYLVVGAQSEDLKGKVVLFQSNDLKEWLHLGTVAGSHEGSLEDFGFMWECPDLFQLDGQDVLIVSPQGLQPEGYKYHNKYQSGYFIGNLDYNQVNFEHGTFTELDRGFEFYAPQTTMDDQGRRIMIGWMGVPEQGEDQQPTIKHNWVHTLTIPRQLHLKEGKLYQMPIRELKSLRQNRVDFSHVVINQEEKELAQVAGDVMELELNKINILNDFRINIRNHCYIHFDKQRKLFSFERERFTGDGMESRHCDLEELKQLSIFLDTSSIEIFINHGQEVFTSRIFPSPHDKAVSFQSSEQITFDLVKWNLN